VTSEFGILCVWVDETLSTFQGLRARGGFRKQTSTKAHKGTLGEGKKERKGGKRKGKKTIPAMKEMEVGTNISRLLIQCIIRP
jgi:hypothetical protein